MSAFGVTADITQTSFVPSDLTAGGVIAGIAVCMSQNRQRLGDMLAHTFVVRVRDL